MKLLFRLLSAAVLCLLPLAAVVVRAAPDAAGAPAAAKVKLTFVDAEKFTDISVNGATDKTSADLVFRELDRHLAAQAKRRLASGQTLTITMRDIDLAGAVEPWRGPEFGRIRYMRDTHPPRLVFDYQLVDAAGAVVKEGAEKLTNLTFRYQTPTTERDTTYYEKQLLTDWMADTFDAPKKAKKKP
jgi:hypothetical protein